MSALSLSNAFLQTSSLASGAPAGVTKGGGALPDAIGSSLKERFGDTGHYFESLMERKAVQPDASGADAADDAPPPYAADDAAACDAPPPYAEASDAPPPYATLDASPPFEATVDDGDDAVSSDTAADAPPLCTADVASPSDVAPVQAVGDGATPTAAPAPAPPQMSASQMWQCDGNDTSMPAADEKAPPGVSASDIQGLSGGLLKNMGNPDLQGQGGMMDKLAQKATGNPNATAADIQGPNADPDATWRAFRMAQAIKDRDTGGGKSAGGDRLNGRIDGFFKDHSHGGKLAANHGTEAGAMQDFLLHGEVPPPATDLPKPPAPGTTLGQQAAIDGHTSDLPGADEQPPPGQTAADIGKMNSGLLNSLGAQMVTMNEQQMTLRTALVMKYGTDDEKKQIKTIPKDASSAEKKKIIAENEQTARDILGKSDGTAWRAYRALTAVKNETAADGTPKPLEIAHSGKIGGYTAAGADGEAPHGSEAGSLQDLLQSNRKPGMLEGNPDDHTDKFGQGQSGGQVALKRLERVGKDIAMGLAMAVLAFVPGFGEVVDTAIGAAMAGTRIGEGIAEGAEAAAQGAARGAEAAADGAAGGAADVVASFGDEAIQGIASQVSKIVGRDVSETDVKQAMQIIVDHAKDAGIQLGKDQLKQYVEQAMEGQQGGGQPIPMDQPRSMASFDAPFSLVSAAA